MTEDLITRTTEDFRDLRKRLTEALRLTERLIEEHRPSIFNLSLIHIYRIRVHFIDLQRISS